MSTTESGETQVTDLKMVQVDNGCVTTHLDKLVRESVEETRMEMYLAGVSVRRIEDITEALWGSRVGRPSAT